MIQVPHIGNQLREYVTKNRIYQSGWAKQVSVTQQTVAGYLRSPNMQVATLFKTCQILNYNFLADIAAMLPQLPHANSNIHNPQLETLQKENETLKIQVETLRAALSLVSGKG